MNKVLFKMLSVMSCLLFMGTVSLAASYTDTEGHWADKAVERWTDYHIVEGYGDQLFKPDENMTRAELAQVVNKLLVLKNKEGSTFTDVDDDAWFYDAISACNRAGIVEGVGENLFDPDASITREEAMVMIARALDVVADEEVNLKDFKDADKVADWAEGLISSMVSKEIVQGSGDGMLHPEDHVTRAEVLEMINKTVTNYVQEDGEYEIAEESGNVTLVVAKKATIKGTFAGNIIVAQGAEEGEITLDGVKAEGEVFIDAENTKIILNDKAEIEKINVIGENDILVVEKGATANDIQIKADNTEVTVNGKVEKIDVTENVSDTEIKGNGKVSNVEVMDGAKNTTIETKDTEVKTSEKSENTVAGGKEVKPGETEHTESGSKPVTPATKYTVTFDANGGVNTAEGEVKVEKGNKVTKPENPTREGYVFVDWYLNDEVYDFENTITEDITLKAMWKFEIKDEATLRTFITGRNGEQDITEDGILTQDIALTSSISIDRDLVLDGNDKTITASNVEELSLVKIMANVKIENLIFDLKDSKNRALYINNAENAEKYAVELVSVTIMNGKVAKSGSAIATNGKVDLTLDTCIIKDNETEVDAGNRTDAAIFFGNTTGTLTLINTQVKNNKSYGLTGGIWVASTAKLVIKEGCDITGNTITKLDEKCEACRDGADIFLNANTSGAGENKGATAVMEGGTVGKVHVEYDKETYAILTLRSGSVEKVHGNGKNATFIIEEGASYQEGENAFLAGTYQWNDASEGSTKWAKQVTIELDNAKLDAIVEDVLGFKASALQEITIENGKANGTLNYIDEEDGAWKDNIWPENEKTGNYLVMFIEEATMDDFEVTCELSGGKNSPVKLDKDGIYLIRLVKVQDVKITITLKNTKLGTESKMEIDLSALQLAVNE